jgi:RimJ/RimL family protein N-acetyltransferase
MKLRPATLQDAALLLEWRNDELTREASINAEPVGWDSHIAWLEASLKNPRRKLLIGETDRAVGTVRIDYGEETELSWTVAPDARGQGVGKAMVMAAMPEGPVIAHIKRGNIGSQKIAEAAGFSLARDGDLQRWERIAKPE